MPAAILEYVTVTCVELPSVPGTVTAPRGRGLRRWVRPALGLLVAGAVAAIAVFARSTVAGALEALTDLRPGWLAAAVAVEAVSVLATAQLHRVLLGAAGAPRPRVGDYLAVTYVGGAVSSSVPGGPALAAAYTYRQLRSRGVTSAHTGWALTAAGVLSTAVIALVGTVALTLAGNVTATTVAAGAAEIAAAAALAALARWAASHPRHVTAAATRVLARWNRIRRRPAGADAARVGEAVATVTAIQPRGRHWAAAAVCAAADWGADASCLALCLLAVGTPIPSLAAIVAAYVAGAAATQLAFTPAGIGVTEAALSAALIAHGSPAAAALAAVLLFRLISPGLNTAIGAALGVIRPLWTQRRRPASRPRRAEIATEP